MSEDIIIKAIAESETKELSDSSNQVIIRAHGFSIADEEDYAEAAEFLKAVKTNIKTVENTFAEMKTQANKAHKTVCETENSFKKPLVEAEKIVKNKMSVYLSLQQAKIDAENKRIMQAQKKLADEQLQKAAELEKAGNLSEAATVFATAAAIDMLSAPLQACNPKANGISTQQGYEIAITDSSAVPIYFNGILLRPIDEAIIKNMVKASKGKVTIPGIEILSKNVIKVKA